MRKLLLIVLLLPVFGKAQTDTINFEWKFIDTIPGTKHELYVKARNWAANILKNSKFALQIDDESLGELRFQTNFYGRQYKNQIACDIEIDLKDSKTRFYSKDYKIVDSYNPFIDGQPLSQPISPLKKAFSKKPNQEWWMKVKDDAINGTKDIYESFLHDMSMKTSSDNW